MINIKEKTSERVSVIMPLKKVSQEGYFLDKKGRIVDIMQVVSKDLENMSEIEKEIEFLKLWKFNKMNAAEVKWISLNFPCNTKQQQTYFRRQIENCKDMHKKKWLQKSLDELIWLEKNRTKREYYLFFFSENKEEHREFIMRNLKIMGNGKEKSLAEMSFRKKCQVLSKMSNQNIQLFDV